MIADTVIARIALKGFDIFSRILSAIIIKKSFAEKFRRLSLSKSSKPSFFRISKVSSDKDPEKIYSLALSN